MRTSRNSMEQGICSSVLDSCPRQRQGEREKSHLPARRGLSRPCAAHAPAPGLSQVPKARRIPGSPMKTGPGFVMCHVIPV